MPVDARLEYSHPDFNLPFSSIMRKDIPVLLLALSLFLAGCGSDPTQPKQPRQPKQPAAPLRPAQPMQPKQPKPPPPAPVAASGLAPGDLQKA